MICCGFGSPNFIKSKSIDTFKSWIGGGKEYVLQIQLLLLKTLDFKVHRYI